MLFHSLEYLVFLPAAWTLYWRVPVHHRVTVLLVASYVFYASWSVPYAALVFALVVVNYLFGLALGRARRGRRILLASFVLFDLAVLGLFKYFDFGARSLADGAGLFGVALAPPLLHLVLPLGISFFTFEFIHYLVDIYRGDVPVHSFSKFHVFAAFFPTQIAGPIKRFQQFVPSLAALGTFDTALAREGVVLIGRGLAKKVLLADRLAPWADRGFGAAADGSIGTADAWLVTLAFSLQIFFDFSGYTDIARGSAALFGFRVPINFDGPYLATSLADFWHRWHISLSTWLRDYVYIPLGGSRRVRAVVVRNLLLTMLLGGLWHGAAWHFVAWGAFWGSGLALHHLARPLFPRAPARILVLAGWASTQLFVLVGWVLFRADSFSAAGTMLRAMAGAGERASLLAAKDALAIVATAAGLVACTLLARGGHTFRPRMPLGRMRPVAYGAAGALTILVALVAAPTGREAFIYFQF